MDTAGRGKTLLITTKNQVINGTRGVTPRVYDGIDGL